MAFNRSMNMADSGNTRKTDDLLLKKRIKRSTKSLNQGDTDPAKETVKNALRSSGTPSSRQAPSRQAPSRPATPKSLAKVSPNTAAKKAVREALKNVAGEGAPETAASLREQIKPSTPAQKMVRDTLKRQPSAEITPVKPKTQTQGRKKNDPWDEAW